MTSDGSTLGVSTLLERAEQAPEVALPRALRVRFIDPDDPGVGVEFVVDGLAVTPFGTLHGAALGAVVELAGFLAVLPTLDLDEHAVTCHIATQYLRAAHAGDRVEVHAQLDRRSRGMGFVTVTAFTLGPSDAVDHHRAGRHPQVAASQITKAIVRSSTT